jgi:hypothetical protein
MIQRLLAGKWDPVFPYPWLLQSVQTPCPVYITQSDKCESMPHAPRRSDFCGRNGELFRKVCLFCTNKARMTPLATASAHPGEGNRRPTQTPWLTRRVRPGSKDGRRPSPSRFLGEDCTPFCFGWTGHPKFLPRHREVAPGPLRELFRVHPLRISSEPGSAAKDPPEKTDKEDNPTQRWTAL